MSETPTFTDEQLIARLLQEEAVDVLAMEQLKQHQISELHLGDVYADLSLTMVPMSDAGLALALMAEEVLRDGDAAYAERLALEQEAEFVSERQFAQKVAAAERLINLDRAFAEKIHEQEEAREGGADAMNVDEYDQFPMISITSR